MRRRLISIRSGVSGLSFYKIIWTGLNYFDGLSEDVPKMYLLACWDFWFLRAFAKVQKAIIGVVITVVCLSVCPSVRMELGCNWTGFHYILYLKIFRKYVKKIQFWLKSDKNNRDLSWRPMFIYDNFLAEFYLK